VRREVDLIEVGERVVLAYATEALMSPDLVIRLRRIS
jgi:hypothetical protein